MDDIVTEEKLTKTVWVYDEVTGELKGAYEAHPSPLEEGMFIEPEHSTDIEPPMAAPREAAVFRDGAWLVVPDYRNAVVYDAQGTGSVITELGVAPEDNGLSETPPPPTYQQLRAAQYPAITDQLDALWHAMDDGVIPVVPAFYDPIKAVKEAIPKV